MNAVDPCTDNMEDIPIVPVVAPVDGPYTFAQKLTHTGMYMILCL